MSNNLLSYSRQLRKQAVDSVLDSARTSNSLPASPRMRVSSSEDLSLSSAWQDLKLETSTTGNGSSLNTNEFGANGVSYNETDKRLEFAGDKVSNYLLSIEVWLTASECSSMPALLSGLMGWMDDNTIEVSFRFVAGSVSFPFPDSEQKRMLTTIQPRQTEANVQFLYPVYANDFLKTEHLKLQVKADLLTRSPVVAESIVLVYPI